MKSFTAALVLCAAPALGDETAAPVAKVIEMLSGLQAKIMKEGEASQKSYDEFAEWCEDSAKNLQYEVKTGKSSVASLKATIAEETSRIEALDAKVDELAATLATASADLKAATEVRNKEAADFAKEESELKDIVDTIGRAVGILEKEMNGGASMMQIKNANNVVEALSIMVKASAMNANDASKITALVQSSEKADSEDSDEETGAPAAATYENQSGGIVEVLNGLQEEAQDKLDSARKEEATSSNNFQMLKSSLEDATRFANQDKAAAQKGIAKSGESKAGAEGELDVTSNDLAADMKSLGDLHQNRMAKATEFEAGTTSRGQELYALAAAKKVIKETTALVQAPSFVQVETQSAGNQAVRLVRELAKKDGSRSLAQLASRMQSTMRLNAGSSDVFAKIKGLIADMIEKLSAEADADATEKAYCDKELGESRAKKGELNTEIEKLSTAIDQASSRSTKLKDEVATLQKELADLAKSQQSWETFRQEEKAVYDHDRPELETALGGIKAALKVLRDYYASGDGAQGAGGGIISLLEVCESDFSKGLAEMISTEEEAVATFTAEMKDIEIENAAKGKDVEYKTKEHVGLDKTVGETSKDRAGVQSELDAVQQYLTQLEGRCIAKAETYESQVQRRNAEIAGLKEALTVLGGEASLLQKSATTMLRGVRRHA